MVTGTSRGRKQLDQNAVPTTSLADMMFLLLIFFIMTTTLARTTGFVTDVPAGAKGPTDANVKTPTITIHDGQITVDEQKMTLPVLQAYLKEKRLDQRSGDAKVVIVTATGNVKYQQYYEVLALVRNSGGIVALVGEEGGQK